MLAWKKFIPQSPSGVTVRLYSRSLGQSRGLEIVDDLSLSVLRIGGGGWRPPLLSLEHRDAAV
jgi:hypothetical protein